MGRKRSFYAGTVALVAFFLGITAPSPAAADYTGCNSSQRQVLYASATVPEGTYDIYVRASTARISLTLSTRQTNESTCHKVGNNVTADTSWKKIGTQKLAHTEEIFYELSTTQSSRTTAIDNSALLLVPNADPPCTPLKDCEFTVGDAIGSVRPITATKPESGDLSISRVVSLKSDSIERVEYYADNELLYTSRRLEKFDQTYIPYQSNTLRRVVYYHSGQSIVFKEDAPDSLTNSFQAFMHYYIKKYKNTLVWLALALTVLGLTWLALVLIQYAERRRQWNIAHGLAVDTQRAASHLSRVISFPWVTRVARYMKWTALAIVGITVTAVLIDSSVGKIATVSGHSMERSLSNGQRIFINKLPLTFARINNSPYVPKRGEIVVARPNFGTIDVNLFQDDGSLIVKRVIGLPGERIVVKDQRITVYNQQHTDGFDPDENSPWSATLQAGTSDDNIDIILSENELFIVGDNRLVSIDSRYNGPINASQVMGLVGL